jgi:hypothetical protein
VLLPLVYLTLLWRRQSLLNQVVKGAVTATATSGSKLCCHHHCTNTITVLTPSLYSHHHCGNTTTAPTQSLLTPGALAAMETELKVRSH